MGAESIWGQYAAKCSYGKCPGVRLFEQGMSMNLQVGDMVPFDPTNSLGTTCPNCKRATLVITSSPAPPAPPPVKGFVKILEK